MKGSYIKCDRCGRETKYNETQVGSATPAYYNLPKLGWGLPENTQLFRTQSEGTADLCPDCKKKYDALVKRLQGELNGFFAGKDDTPSKVVTDHPEGNHSYALNMFYVKDGQAWVRDGGETPDHSDVTDVTLYDFTRRIIKEHNLEIPADTDEELGWSMDERLDDGTDTLEGVAALLYRECWVAAELRERLKGYEERGEADDAPTEEENKT